MADGVNVQVEGGDELLRKLKRMGVNVSAVLEVAAVAGAVVIRNQSRALAPGPEIEHKVIERTPNEVGVDVGPDKKKWYYTFFETGAGPHVIKGSPLLAFEGSDGGVVTRVVHHPGMAAAPFLRPAFDDESNKAADEVGATLKKPILAETI